MNPIHRDRRLLLFALFGSLVLHTLVLFAFDIRFETPEEESRVLSVQLVPHSLSSVEEQTTLTQELDDPSDELDIDNSSPPQDLVPQHATLQDEIDVVESQRDSHRQPESTIAFDPSDSQESSQEVSTSQPSESAQEASPNSQLSIRDLVNAATAIAREQNPDQNVRNITGNEATNTEEQYYLQAWHKKVQEIGQLNYPQEAIENKLYGKLRLYVAIKPDGSLKETKVIRSSGHEVLDEAAIDIVELAAPFSAFPKSMRESLDLLEIVRDWEFRREALVPTTESEGD